MTVKGRKRGEGGETVIIRDMQIRKKGRETKIRGVSGNRWQLQQEGGDEKRGKVSNNR